jgi:hypothetical protein
MLSPVVFLAIVVNSSVWPRFFPDTFHRSMETRLVVIVTGSVSDVIDNI